MEQQNKSLKVLEWNTILKNLSAFSTSEIGKERCLNTFLYSNIDKIQHEQSLTSQSKYLLDQNFIPPLGGIRKIQDALDAAKVGQTLKNTELLDIASTIGASRRLKSFFSKYHEETPLLFEIAINLFENKILEEEIINTFDDAGLVVDSASPELKRLRSSLKDQSFNLKNKLNRLIQSSEFSKYLQEPVYTQRGDRFVLPVKAEFKSHVQGIIHDSSASGATLFIEPKIIVEMNNALKETELKIDYEINRILAELSNKVKYHTEEIEKSLYILAEIDFIFAKAKYSISLKAIEPKLNNDKVISLNNVKHPILLTTIENVVPNNIEIGKDWVSLIITGSNTGGKTVILKTTGLCVLLTKAGMHVPALEANIYPFKNIFADIGDEQSITQNLSTFSGHMSNIIGVLNHVDNDSLVLLDEIGAGTDPQEGSALAQAILENLSEKEARTIVTTHYGELKALAYTKKGFYNASVEFDTSTLQPTYKLLMGIPGKSNAITIALNLGLGENIANNAQEIYITQKDTTGEVLEGLQNTQQELSRNAQIIETSKEEIEKLEKDYNEKLEKLNADKKQTINVFKKKFNSLLESSKSEIKDILEEIRRTKSEKVIRRAYTRLNQIETDLREAGINELDELEPEFEAIDWNNIETGQAVFVKSLNQDATLLSMPDKNKNVQVQVGLLKTTIKIDKIAKSGKKFINESEKTHSSGKSFRLNRSNISNTLDLRGMKVEEALNKTDIYLDEASLANLTPVYIIHGHGTGALRHAIREYLSSSPYVSKFRPGEQTEGGNGVSVVDLA
jgi:DNA mismatch repair protein MutS2